MEVDVWNPPLPMVMRLKNKIDELDKVHTQLVKGMITVREALSQRIRIMTDCQAILKEMIAYELGE